MIVAHERANGPWSILSRETLCAVTPLPQVRLQLLHDSHMDTRQSSGVHWSKLQCLRVSLSAGHFIPPWYALCSTLRVRVVAEPAGRRSCGVCVGAVEDFSREEKGKMLVLFCCTKRLQRRTQTTALQLC